MIEVIKHEKTYWNHYSVQYPGEHLEEQNAKNKDFMRMLERMQ